MMINETSHKPFDHAGHNAFQVGWLRATLRHSISIGCAPGIRITSKKKFEAWVEEQIKQAEEEATKHILTGK